MAKKDIIIKLDSSTFAHKFEEHELIHLSEFQKALKLVEERVKVARRWEEGLGQSPLSYDTISIFGERGTGKTSFLLSLLEKVHEQYREEVKVLNVVDPTMIEEKEHIFLLIIALIKKEVDSKLSGDECRLNTKAYEQKTIWDQQLLKLAKGLPTLGKVGVDHKTNQWQDHDFIMERGLKDVLSAFTLREEFHKLVSLALTILNKKAFVLALDDIDVDINKGWDVLEMLRKYVNTPQIITLLSGNLKLYSLNVRRKQWEQLETNRNHDSKDYGRIVNELEGQYLLKVLRTENRIHLQSLLQLLQFGLQYKIEAKDGTQETIKELYKNILAELGIKGYTQLTMFRNYLLSLSVRSQIQFLNNNSPVSERRTGAESIEAFLSRLYAANIDVESAVNNVNMLNLIIQGYIQQQPSTPELYLLTPSYEDADLNACLTAFTILFVKGVERNPFLIFDYFVRMGYVRNLMLGMNNRDRADFYNRAGLVQNMSLKNNVGLSMGYSISNHVHKDSHIELKGLAEKSKGSSENDKERIDAVVKGHANQAQAIIAYLPISVLKHTYKNESRVYYSIYNLMACISEILQNSETDEETEEKNKEIAIAKIKSQLLNLQQLRTYTVLTRQGDMQTRHIEDEEAWSTSEVKESTLPEDQSFDTLAESIYEWKKSYHQAIPPYLIGKIATRLYYTVHKISEDNLGEQMHRIVMALLHACLIEEAQEYYVRKEGKMDVTKINTSNVVTDDKNFIANLQFIVRNEAIDQIPFTMWMIKCPLLWAFTDSSVLKNIRTTVHNEADEDVEVAPYDSGLDECISVFEVLKRVQIKDNPDKTKPMFSGSRTGIFETVRILRENGIDVNYILNEGNTISAVTNILGVSGLFQRKPYAGQIESFRANYHLVQERDAAQEETPTPAAEPVERPVREAEPAPVPEQETDANPAIEEAPRRDSDEQQ